MIKNNKSAIILTSIFCFTLFAVMVFQAEADQNPTVKGQIQSIPPNMSLKGLRVIAYNPQGSKEITATADASGMFVLKGLPFSANLVISASNKNIISENIKITTGSKFEAIKLSEPLKILMAGPPNNSGIWFIDNGKSTAIQYNVFNYVNNSCNGGFPQNKKGRLTVFYKDALETQNIPIVTKDTWIVLQAKIQAASLLEFGTKYNTYDLNEFVLASVDYYREKSEYINECSNCTDVIPSGFYIGIKDITLGTYNKTYCFMPITVETNYTEVAPISIDNYRAFKIDNLPPGRWAVAKKNVITDTRGFAPMGKNPELFAWTFEIK